MRHRALAATLALVAALLGGCAGLDFGLSTSPDGVTTSTRDAQQAASLISAYRRAKGLGAVSADGQLNAAAVHQAKAVAVAGRLSHGDFGDRMGEYGIRGAAAENLTAGSDTVAGAIARWKASPAHDANLLMADARRIGLARADSPGAGYRHYWALVLAQ